MIRKESIALRSTYHRVITEEPFKLLQCVANLFDLKFQPFGHVSSIMLKNFVGSVTQGCRTLFTQRIKLKRFGTLLVVRSRRKEKVKEKQGILVIGLK